MRFLEKYEDGTYMEKCTNNVRGNNGYVLPNDAVFQGIGINIVKFKHHKAFATFYWKHYKM